MSESSHRPAPNRLVVGNIEIDGGQIRIGGVDMTGGMGSGPSPASHPLPPGLSGASMPPPQAPQTVPPRQMAPSLARPQTPGPAGLHAPGQVPVSHPGAGVKALTVASPEPPGALAQNRVASEPQALVATPSGEARQSITVVNVGGGASQGLAGLGLTGTLVGIVVTAERALDWGMPFGWVAGGVVLASAAAIAGWRFFRRKARTLRQHQEQLQEQQLERELVRLADKQGGQVRVVDVVRELGMSFEESQGLLTRLAAKGHITLEFDPATQGPVYRVG